MCPTEDIQIDQDDALQVALKEHMSKDEKQEPEGDIKEKPKKEGPEHDSPEEEEQEEQFQQGVDKVVDIPEGQESNYGL